MNDLNENADNKFINDDPDNEEHDLHCCDHDHEHGHNHNHEKKTDCCHGHGHTHDHDHHDHSDGCGCSCGHDHGHQNEDDIKKNLKKIIIAAILFVIVFVVDKIVNLSSVFPGNYNWILPFVCYLAAYLVLGKDIVKEAVEGVLHGELLDENFLMTIASLGAFALGIYKGCIGEEPDGFEEGCAVILFYSIGEWFQSWALGRSRRSIAGLMDIRPDVAHVFSDGNIYDEEPEHVQVGSELVVRTGEKVPIDGILLSESAELDTMALTGESEYEKPCEGSVILSGSINMGTEIRIRTEKAYDDSTVARILELVENSPEKKTNTENFISRFARIYTPVVVILAICIAVLPPLFGLISGAASAGSDLTWTTWIYRALSFLVVSCPCALVISIPLSFFMGIGTASKHHILVKGSNCIELVSNASVYISDKTGTLTIGRDIKPEAGQVISWIKQTGAKIFILSGDKRQIVEDVANELGISEYAYELKPDEKVNRLEEILTAKNDKDIVVYLGDGINDAPSLIRADVGISMGNIGSDAAVEASDIVLMKDDLNGIPIIKKIADKTMMIVRENIVFSIGIKVVVLILSAIGLTNMWVAVFADVGVALLAILNALRVGIIKYDSRIYK